MECLEAKPYSTHEYAYLRFLLSDSWRRHIVFPLFYIFVFPPILHTHQQHIYIHIYIYIYGSIPGGVSGFYIDIRSFRSHYDSGVESASNKNEYQEYFLVVKAAGA